MQMLIIVTGEVVKRRQSPNSVNFENGTKLGGKKKRSISLARSLVLCNEEWRRSSFG